MLWQHVETEGYLECVLPSPFKNGGLRTRGLMNRLKEAIMMSIGNIIVVVGAFAIVYGYIIGIGLFLLGLMISCTAIEIEQTLYMEEIKLE